MAKNVYRNAKPDGDFPVSAPKDEIRREFARRLQAAMVEKDMNQSDLGRKAGIGRDNVSNYIRGKNLPLPAVVRRLADALGVEASWLLPSAALPSVDKDSPSLAMRVGQDGKAWIQVNQAVDLNVALQIMQLLQKK